MNFPATAEDTIAFLGVSTHDEVIIGTFPQRGIGNWYSAKGGGKKTIISRGAYIALLRLGAPEKPWFPHAPAH
jgi:hypothetical protein